jgi:hypothetical protein
MSLPTIIDHEIITAMKTAFTAVTAGTEYYNTFSAVYDNFPGDYSKYPAGKNKIINIRESSDDLAMVQTSGDLLHDILLTIDIDIIAKNTAAADLRKMKADVLKCIGNNDTWGGRAFYTNYQGMTRNKTNHMGDLISDCTITIAIHYRKNAWSK